jgi:ABC-type Fe3+ transport system permease subunit
VAGAASVATLPVAIYLTRFSDAYELLHAGFAIPIAAALALLALALARRARRRHDLQLGRAPRTGSAGAGRVLGIVGLCLAAAAVVALAVYGLLEYAGTR